MDQDLFEKWFRLVFVPHCGLERPVLLIMDNHDSHISIPVIQCAMENEIILLGLPGHTTHLLQALDMKIIGPLKEKVMTIATGLGYMSTGMSVGKAKFPVLLHYATQQLTPGSVADAFTATGICPFRPDAIDTSQLVLPSFKTNDSADDHESEQVRTCGTFLTNPLLKRGLIASALADILLPPPTSPRQEKKKGRLVMEGRVISSQDMLIKMKEKAEAETRRKEETEKRKAEVATRKEQKTREKAERKLKRQIEKEARLLNKQRKEEERIVKRKKREEARLRKMEEKEKNERLHAERGKGKSDCVKEYVASLFVCSRCGEKGTVSVACGLTWYGCDEEMCHCGRWYHERCLEIGEREYLHESLSERSAWFCKKCKLWIYEE